MPHKHSRREQNPSDFDLPPSVIAKPLPVPAPAKLVKNNGKPSRAKPVASVQKSSKRKRGGDDLKDDAPRAFKRLMAFAGGKKPRSSLDDGLPSTAKKTKKNVSSAAANSTTQTSQASQKPSEPLTIKPGEKLSDFARRVDAALPISGLASKPVKNGKDPVGLKVWRTNKERKMHKLYDRWREEERKLQDRRAEQAELAEERAAEEGDLLPVNSGEGGDESSKKGKKKRGKRARLLDEVTDKEEDPWLALKKLRGEGRIGLHDVAKAPPELPRRTGKLLTVRGAAVKVDGIPKAAGSLRRREELQGVRNELVASYRKMMDQKKADKQGAAGRG